MQVAFTKIRNSKMSTVKQYNIADDIEILGHVFHGLQDIKQYVESSLYQNYSRGQASEWEPRKRGEVHVGEMWKPYPCFDSEDFASENRSYQNFIFRTRPITQEDMRRLSDLPSAPNECRVSEQVPADMLPIAFYPGDGEYIWVAEP